MLTVSINLGTSSFVLSVGTTEIPLTDDDFALLQEGVVPAGIKSTLTNSNVSDDELIKVARSTPLPEYNVTISATDGLTGYIRMGSGRPIDPEPLKEILKPVFIEGYRHSIVFALAGWLKRHSVPEEKTLEIVRSLNPSDKTPAKTAATVRETYRNSGRTIGLPSLIGIIANIASEGKISRETAKGVIEALEAKGAGFSAGVELEQKQQAEVSQ